MKIYTKTGDQGETGLLGGKRVNKNHLCIEVCGGLDELNSWIGVVRSQSDDAEINSELELVQQDLFCVGAVVAGCLSDKAPKKDCRIAADRTDKFEQIMDHLTDELPPLTAFVLPGGSPAASWTHLARNVCRRAERQLVDLVQEGDPQIDLAQELVYLNRLSDLLFLYARKLNACAEQAETLWLP